jgi:hypothetical protein
MTDDLAQPNRQALAAQNRSLPGKVTGRLRNAIDAMVWKAASRKEAAQMAAMTDHSLRQALRRPHVMGYYLAECEVLRLSGRAKRLHRLEELASQDRNINGAVAAIKAAEQIEDDTRASGRAGLTAPGLIIVIGNQPVAQPPAPIAIDAVPAEVSSR